MSYVHIKFVDNHSEPYEKKTNPRNLAITPSQIANLTADGKAVSMHQADGALYYPECNEDVLPLEFQRGIDINDCWEESQSSTAKVQDYVRRKANNKPNVESENVD